MQKNILRATLLAGAAFVMVGCHATIEEQPAGTQSSLDEAQRHIGQIDASRQRLASAVARLPGTSADAHREIATDAFTEISRILRELHSVSADAGSRGAFEVQLRTIEQARDQLRAGGERFAVDPAVEQGLFATHRALVRILHVYPRAVGAQTDIEALERTNQELDATLPGAQQRWVASRGLRQAASALDKIVTIVKEDVSAKPASAE